MIFKGFRLGMMLQLAVGPICLFVFQSATRQGFVPSLAAVLGVTLVDSLFILAAVLGIAAFMEKPGVQTGLNLFGAVTLSAFGVVSVLGAFGLSPVPAMNLHAGESGLFWQAVVLTGANPLTIVFWAGVFASRLGDLQGGRRGALCFGLGAALTTPLSLTAVAAIGTATQRFLPEGVITGLNVMVGLILIVFGARMGRKAFRKTAAETPVAE